MIQPLAIPASLGIEIAMSPLHAALSGLLSGASRKSAYLGNELDPNVIPPIDAIMDARIRGAIDGSEAYDLLRDHGIVNDRKSLSKAFVNADKVWDNTYSARYVRPDAATLFQLASRGFFGDITTDPEEKKRFTSLLKWTKAFPGDWKEWLESLKYTLTPLEINILRNRQFFTGVDATNWLTATGVISGKEREAYKQLSRVVPPPTELAIMARRFAFAPQDVIDALGLDAEYPDEFAYWAERQGFGKVDGFTGGQADGKSQDFAKNIWRTHWNTIAPTLAYLFYQQCRPNHDNFGVPPELQGLVFPYSDPDPKKLTLQLALRDAGYSEPWRKFLARISFRKLGFRQTSQIQYYGLEPGEANDKGKAWITQRLQDAGYQQQEADLYAQTLIKTNAQRKAGSQLGITRALIEDSWSIGIIDGTIANQYLQQIGLSADEANAAVTAWELKRQHDLGKKSVSAIRRNFLLGDLTEIEAKQELGVAGITLERANQYISLWYLEQRQYRLERSPAILTNWFVMGTIDGPEMTRRLSQIGWASEDIQRIMLVAIRKALKAGQQVYKGKGGRGSKGKAKELSNAELKALFKRNMISVQRATDGLDALGYDAEDTQLLLSLWRVESSATNPA